MQHRIELISGLICCKFGLDTSKLLSLTGYSHKRDVYWRQSGLDQAIALVKCAVRFLPE